MTTVKQWPEKVKKRFEFFDGRWQEKPVGGLLHQDHVFHITAELKRRGLRAYFDVVTHLPELDERTGKRVEVHPDVLVIAAGNPNQDALRWWPGWPDAVAGPPLLAAVADGHGSAKSFRSDVGARLAVKVATRQVPQFLDDLRDTPGLLDIERMARERLPQEMVDGWSGAVLRHLKRYRFKDEDWARLAAREGQSAQHQINTNPRLAYGATLLTVLVAEQFILYFKLGDGDIVCVGAGGEATRPLPTDERLIANETTSLCTHHPRIDARVGIMELGENAPSLILISTDGYKNSFLDDAGFLKVGPDILKVIRSDGLESVSQRLDEWLARTSHVGSGDDITVALLYRDRDDAPNRAAEAVEAAEGPVGQDQASDQEQRTAPSLAVEQVDLPGLATPPSPPGNQRGDP